MMPDAVGDLAAEHIVAVEVADHPAAAVVEHQCRARAVFASVERPVNAYGDSAMRRGDLQVFDRSNLRWIGLHRGARRIRDLARFGRRNRVVGRTVGSCMAWKTAARLDREMTGIDRRNSRCFGRCMIKLPCARRRRCRRIPRHNSLHRKRGRPRWRRLLTPDQADAPESARPSAHRGQARCRDCGPSRIALSMRLSIRPGQTQLTRTPVAAHSCAALLVRPITACLLAL